MPDITDLMNKYRECARNLWNSYFRMPNPRRSQVDAAFRFDQINELIFNELVLRNIGKLDKTKKKREPWPFLTVGLFGESCSAIVQMTSQDGREYWDENLNDLNRNAVLKFISYFDWDEFDYIDYRYYKVKIISFPEHPELVGREALVETSRCRVYFVDE